MANIGQSVSQYDLEARTPSATQVVGYNLKTYPDAIYAISAMVTAKNPSTGDTACFFIKDAWKNVSGTAARVGGGGSVFDLIAGADSALSSVSVALNNSGSQVQFLLTGKASTNLVWELSIEVRRCELQK